MFLLKIVGSLIVIISSSMIGIIYGSSFSKRLNNLKYLSNCIHLLQTEVMFAATPIPEALEQVYNKGNKKVSYIFKEINTHLKESYSTTESFNHVASILKEELSFTKEDIEIFLSLGRVLGRSDRQDQKRHFETVLLQLEAQREDATEKKKKNEKMYKSLGVLGGILIAILLF